MKERIKSIVDQAIGKHQIPQEGESYGKTIADVWIFKMMDYCVIKFAGVQVDSNGLLTFNQKTDDFYYVEINDLLDDVESLLLKDETIGVREYVHLIYKTPHEHIVYKDRVIEKKVREESDIKNEGKVEAYERLMGFIDDSRER